MANSKSQKFNPMRAPKKPKKVNSPLKFSTPWLPSNAKNKKEIKKATDNAYKIGKNPYQKSNDALHKKIANDMLPAKSGKKREMVKPGPMHKKIKAKKTVHK